jgi:hypothetical protein
MATVILSALTTGSTSTGGTGTGIGSISGTITGPAAIYSVGINSDSCQLNVYNGALLIIGERFLANLTEEREPRRLLDHVWASDGVITCLELGQWNFAMRTIRLDYDPSVEPDFGYARAFQKPEDWVLTASVCADEFFRAPLTRYFDEARYIYSDLDAIYFRYVSADVEYGMDCHHWPASFREFVFAHFASRIVRRLTNNETEVERVFKLREKLLLTAKSRAAMAEPTSFPARGTWGLSRNRFPNRRDGGGATGNLIG